MSGDDQPPDGNFDRRTLVRLLIALAVGIPILVEALTFAGLIQNRFGGDGDGDGATTTSTRPAVGVGDDLLSETPQAETLTAAAVRADRGWRLSLTVAVENTDDHPYQLNLEAVTTEDGTTVSDRVTTGRLDPGASTTLTGTWDLPDGSRPATLTVVAVTFTDGGTQTTTAAVPLARINVQS